MIVTLTVNPSLDRTMTLEAALAPGEVQAAASERQDAGGKGINVARVIAAAGADVLAVLPLGADDPLGAVLRGSGIDTRHVPIAARTRANITIADPAGVTTKLNLPGPRFTEAEASALVDAVVEACAGARWLVLAGSLPPGTADDFYVHVIDAVRLAHGADAPRVAVDTSGPALRAAVDRGRPDLIKPNDQELAELAGVQLAADDVADVLAVARRIVPERARAALVTLGAAGAVLVTADGAWRGSPPPTRVASTVGAGDSSLAGYLLAEAGGDAPVVCLRHAIRYGSAAASLPGTQAPAPADLPTGDVPIVALH